MKFFKVSLIIVSLSCLIGLEGCSDNNDPIAGDTGSTGTTGSTGDTGSVNENPVNGLTLITPFQNTNTVFAFAADEYVNVIHPAGKPMRGTFVQNGEQVTIELDGWYINCSYDGATFTILGFEDKLGSHDYSNYSTFDHNGVQRYYRFHKPEDLPENAPLVFSLHGWGGHVALEDWLGLDAVADANGFAVCYAQGRPDQSGMPHWNAGPGAWFSPSDDVGFLSSLAGHLQSEHNLNPEKTFVVGFSNGATMTYTLAMEAPDVFKGMLAFMGNISDVEWANREDRSAIFPLLLVVGLLDIYMPIEGGDGSPHMDDLIAHWVGKNSCSDSEIEDVSPTTTAYKYINCENSNEIWYYKIGAFGHDMPEESNNAMFSGVQLIWDFFKKF